MGCKALPQVLTPSQWHSFVPCVQCAATAPGAQAAGAAKCSKPSKGALCRLTKRTPGAHHVDGILRRAACSGCHCLRWGGRCRRRRTRRRTGAPRAVCAGRKRTEAHRGAEWHVLHSPMHSAHRCLTCTCLCTTLSVNSACGSSWQRCLAWRPPSSSCVPRTARRGAQWAHTRQHRHSGDGGLDGRHQAPQQDGLPDAAAGVCGGGVGQVCRAGRAWCVQCAAVITRSCTAHLLS